MALQYSPKIVTDNLVMCLDPSQNKSYPTTDLPVKGGLVMWMDAADDSTFSYSSGTTVSQWRDKSGFNYHMVPKSGGPTRTAVLNSRKALAFTTSQTIGNNSIDLSGSANTVFVVSRLTGTTNGRVLTCNLDASGNNWLLGHHGGTSNAYYAEGWVYDSSGASTSFQIYMGDWSGSSTDLANFYINGTAYATNNTAASQGPKYLGLNYYSAQTSTCEAAEIIVFNRVLTTPERRLVHTYLGQKWGISNTDRSIIDLSGNDDNGLFGNGSTSNMPLFDYYNKGAFKFYASNKYIKLGTSTTINQFAGDFAISLWAMATAENSNWGNLIGDWYTSGTTTLNEWQIMMNNSSTMLSVYRWNTGSIFYVASGFSANTWINVVLSRVGSTLTLYANNTVVGTTTNSSVFGSTTGNVNIGIDGDSSSERFTGLISNVLIYNKGLSAAEVAQNYQAQKSRFDNTIVQQGLVLNLDAGNPYSYAGAGTTWYDVSGNNYSGSLTNGPVYSTTNSGIIVFDGSNDYVDLTSNTFSISGNASRSMFAWVKTTYNGNQAFIATGTPAGSQAFILVKYGSYVGVMGYNNDFYPSSGRAIADGIWHYVGATFDGTNLRTYVDGVLDNTSGTITYSTTGQNNYVGRSNHAGNENFINGSMGNAQIYNRALTAAEVLQNYNATKGRFGL